MHRCLLAVLVCAALQFCVPPAHADAHADAGTDAPDVPGVPRLTDDRGRGRVLTLRGTGKERTAAPYAPAVAGRVTAEGYDAGSGTYRPGGHGDRPRPAGGAGHGADRASRTALRAGTAFVPR
ncbi:hypothetical protein [Streptomyces sp. NPDC003023]|uniref:hypothetical protein n=1 Tax=Streptomyces sp. NPDC003023 TaxID=3364675 RepID=UPI0036D025C5